METPDKPDRAGTTRKQPGAHGAKPAPEGLTCDEGQIEDLFSGGESTEDEDDAEGRKTDRPAP